MELTFFSRDSLNHNLRIFIDKYTHVFILAFSKIISQFRQLFWQRLSGQSLK